MSSSRIHCYIQNLRKNISLSKMNSFVVESSVLRLKKKSLSFSPPRELQTPFSSLGTPRLLISLPRNRLSQQGHEESDTAEVPERAHMCLAWC